MTPAQDRRHIVTLIDEATAAGARLTAACAALGLSSRTLQRWRDPEDGIRDDLRPFADRPTPANRLSEEERDRIVATCASPEFASLPPSQIVPRLADQGTYIASESCFYRVLRERDQNHRRGRARPATRRRPPTSINATAPCQVWSWDITWLPGSIAGAFFYLYLIVDIFSRKPSGPCIARNSPPGCFVRASRTALQASAGRSTTARRPSLPPGSWSARSGQRGA